MKKIAIIYVSKHHMNTEKLVKSLKDVETYKLEEVKDLDLTKYDAIGIASGVYGFQLDKSITDYVNSHIKNLKNVFLMYTSASGLDKYGVKYTEDLKKKGLNVLGFYQCRGFNTFGPFKLFGGTSKGHPNEDDLKGAQEFLDGIQK